MRNLALPLLALLAFVTPAYAADGVLEINQTCAMATGCFAGDTAGFPITIAAGRSYRLTGNLDATGAGADAIAITTDNVIIDLGGFSIKTNSVSLITSTGSGTRLLNGILSSTANPSSPGVVLGDNSWLVGVRADRVAFQLGSACIVRDGSFAGVEFATTLQTGDSCEISNSFLAGGAHSFTALSAGAKASVRNNEISVNDGTAIFVGLRSTVSENRARGLSGAGISAGSESLIVNNAVGRSRQAIICGAGCIIRSNTANNSANGIRCDRGCRISDNVTNGATNNGEGGHGIRCGGSCTVTGNTANDNVGFGLFDDVGGTSYGNNQFGTNNGGNANPQVSGGIQMGTNICGGDTVCP